MSDDASRLADGQALDRAALDKLASDMEDESFALAFARRYQQLLERRVSRIESALEDADLDRAMDALLSLKVSSTTAGTRELMRLATDMEADVRTMDLGSARRRADGLRDAAARADRALAAYLRV
ncbi:hypothetical protein [Nocardioides sp. CFH 31398]|uniref:hypothetical protein n=1 Tax=Nocardioides sp. CFH 31398 TaxID=2919579 RepID=UPI001F050EB4|nr:hypothetical protein [Nocardioides sp. CFH 31398]MCH1868504.1 hypothetical protein [Nocardioides sp. CFH 31398]